MRGRTDPSGALRRRPFLRPVAKTIDAAARLGGHGKDGRIEAEGVEIRVHAMSGVRATVSGPLIGLCEHQEGGERGRSEFSNDGRIVVGGRGTAVDEGHYALERPALGSGSAPGAVPTWPEPTMGPARSWSPADRGRRRGRRPETFSYSVLPGALLVCARFFFRPNSAFRSEFLPTCERGGVGVEGVGAGEHGCGVHG